MGVAAIRKLLGLKKVLKQEATVKNAAEMLRARIAPPGIEGTTQDLKAAIGNFNTIEKRLDAFDARRRGVTSTERLSNPGPRIISLEDK